MNALVERLTRASRKRSELPAEAAARSGSTGARRPCARVNHRNDRTPGEKERAAAAASAGALTPSGSRARAGFGLPRALLLFANPSFAIARLYSELAQCHSFFAPRDREDGRSFYTEFTLTAMNFIVFVNLQLFACRRYECF